MTGQPEVRTEWGVQWPGDPTIEQGEPWQLEEDGGEAYARRVAKQYRADGAQVVQREVHASAWRVSP
jgi:hypothetical protein